MHIVTQDPHNNTVAPRYNEPRCTEYLAIMNGLSGNSTLPYKKPQCNEKVLVLNLNEVF